jgi:hypothetical protein
MEYMAQDQGRLECPAIPEVRADPRILWVRTFFILDFLFFETNLSTVVLGFSLDKLLLVLDSLESEEESKSSRLRFFIRNSLALVKNSFKLAFLVNGCSYTEFDVSAFTSIGVRPWMISSLIRARYAAHRTKKHE